MGELEGETFDGACSNLGGLNCTDGLSSLAHDLARIMKPGGVFIATVMPRFCLWETAAFLVALPLAESVQEVIAGAGRLRTFTAGTCGRIITLRGISAGHSPRISSTCGLSGLPSRCPRRTSRGRAFLTDMMGGVDDMIAGLPLFRSIGDHYSIVLRRKT